LTPEPEDASKEDKCRQLSQISTAKYVKTVVTAGPLKLKSAT
jgi:hypothetical protein